MDHHPLGNRRGTGREERPLTVSQVAADWDRSLRSMGSVQVVGEVLGLSLAASGHLYFDLTDGKSRIHCKAWSSALPGLEHIPKDGDEVVVRGIADFYGPFAKTSLTVRSCQRAGEGDLAALLARLEAKLRAEGLFDAEHKKSLPLLPKKVGVVSSLKADGLRDFLQSKHLRAPQIPVLVAHASVQGKQAEAELIKALEALDARSDCSVIAIVRGGGAAEDLLPFSSEAVVRAIAACRCPVVVGVGHQPDHPIAEYVADQVAHTPTHAAELIFPVMAELDESLRHLQTRLQRSMQSTVQGQRHELDLADHRLRAAVHMVQMEASARLQGLDRRLREAHPLARLRQDRLALTRLNDRLNAQHPRFGLAEARHRWEEQRRRLVEASRLRLARSGERLALLAQRLDSASPLKVLARGYALVEHEDGRAIGSTEQLTVDQEVGLRFAKGRAKAQIKEVLDD